MVYDVIIIGAGPAGLAAALDAEYLKLKTLILEAGKAGGALIQSYPWKGVDSYLGFKDMKGKEVADRVVSHAKSMGAEIHEMETVLEVKRGKTFRVKTDKNEYEARAVIFATGIRGVPRKLSVEGESLDGIVHSVSDPKKFKGKKVLVVGGGDFAADCALGLDGAGARVWMAHRKDKLRATDDNREKIAKSGIKMLWNHEVEKFSGGGKLESATLFNNKTDEKMSLNLDAAVICIGSIPAADCLQKLGIKIEKVCVEVDKEGMTSIPGIFAAGDIVTDIKRIPQALATGEKAVYSAYKYLKNPYWK
ncbi:MAG: NAD(P)-binding domain-containing protein [Candidatus Aenigmatarchaeota archaeon]|nr:MAG: NAD(P)-binding domain-containing protein [Candidatus Aenigmarchaeota archaeon]